MRPALAVLLALGALAALPAASAHAEAEAPTLRADVVRVWHEPEVLQGHRQWTGFLQLEGTSNVTAVHYQICRVGQACFAPPAAATAIGNGTYRFDTAAYGPAGKPVDYRPGWRLGVVWWLDEPLPNGTAVAREFPAGPDLSSPQCQGDAAGACAEAHYFVVEVAQPPRRAPTVASPMLCLAAAAAAMAARRLR